mmetsp:Transcript_24288/g.35997  ORF Transcript_24288/g.35997 Transcript_24288/m.35997 type:complete len:555 (+) Transcript_24288:188-1852(+)|eukprot:CAMPEP_0194209274 /NCGR_PEP_ID=MMETSP0156-20130528/7461_1 /TAXON_ID=33649 /ORGANISM="Thalassionema nitzschioides, Strain L26-B" /LENGTH=554 /DNA_ID=CAMNT_0038936415 /DNA_START=101 /DNA_END=1765 /DNA_ORIENTATION=-
MFYYYLPPFIITLIAFTASANEEGLISSVITANGVEIVGHTNGGVDSFLGIPYAEVSERFAVSQVRPLGDDKIDALSFGPSCMQSPDFSPPGTQMSEDCLSINIWKPSDVNEMNPTTTMVWIHGGGFYAGSGSEELYNGARMAREQGVIVVTLNYRLGIFGFLAQDENSGEGGMNGINDQINALQWVNQHISFFGGDTNDITIFGQSAGGVSVCLLSVSPLAKGLFKRSIIESGQCISDRLSPFNPEEGAAVTRQLLDNLKVDTISDLSAFKAEELLAASVSSTFTSIFDNPTMDGLVMPEQPIELYNRADAINPTDIIVGATSYDDPSLLGIPWFVYVFRATFQFKSYIQGLFGDDATTNAIMEAYSPKLYYNRSRVRAMAQFSGDFLFRCFSRELAAIAANHITGNSYLYNFAHLNVKNDIASTLIRWTRNSLDWASHTAELPFIFGNLDYTFNGPAKDPIPTLEEVVLSKEIMTRWANFAKTGDPNTSSELFSNNNNWIAVPQTATNGVAASEVPSYIFQGGGSYMSLAQSPENTKKMRQCSTIPGIMRSR